MILLVAVAAGIGVALLRGGRLCRLADLPLRLGWVAVASVVAQLFVIYSAADRLEADRPIHAALLVGSYSLLAMVVWANRGTAGMSMIGVGLLLNLAVMVGNGGFMPISQEAVLTAGVRSAEELPANGARLPRSKDVVLPIEETRLWFLSDVIAAPGVPVAKVCSVGDLITGLGAFVLLQAAMMSQRGETRKEAGAKAA